MDSRKRHKRQSHRKSQIVAAASRVIAEQGPESLSLTAVARQADISKGTLYYYYPTKEALIFDIAEKHVRDITDFIFELMEAGGTQPSPEDLLRLLFSKHRDDCIRMKLHLNLVCQAMHGNDDLRQRYREIYAYWHARAVEALGRLFPEKEDHETLAHVLITTIDGLNIQTMLGLKTVSVKALARWFATALAGK